MSGVDDIRDIRAMEQIIGGSPGNIATIAGDDILSVIDNSPSKLMKSRKVIMPADSAVGIARFTIGEHSSEVAASDNATLVLSTKCSGHLAAEFSGFRGELGVRPGMLTFVPYGLTQQYDFRGTTTNIVLSLNKSLFDQVLSMDTGLNSSGLSDPRLDWTRPLVQKLVEEQFATMASAEAGWKILAEANNLKLAVELLRALGETPKKTASEAALAQAEINRIADFVDAEIHRNFGLTEMAQVLELDQFAFSRAFKAATGESPHQFTLQRRLMRARELLADSSDTIAGIAYDCGFSSQAHMTSTFSKHLGITPAAYRRDVRK